jgi:hypothetical protein
MGGAGSYEGFREAPAEVSTDSGETGAEVEEENLYEERCETCGGKQYVTGSRPYYNGRYDCCTLYLTCENCGPYEVECV